LIPTNAQSQNIRPIADAGPVRYAGPNPIVLDGSDSYDPDDSGSLIYSWRQISGPSVTIENADTATPSIGIMAPGEGRNSTPTLNGFNQTDTIQECEFELVVSDRDLTSLKDTVKVVIVPDFGDNLLELKNASFDPQKPTIVYFGGGDCVNGSVQYSDCPLKNSGWLEKANIIYVPKGYGPDPGGGTRTYHRFGDMLLVYLSAFAPDYQWPIQTCGWSTGGQPAIDSGIRLNLTYKDRRYAVNRVTFFDATPFCQDYSTSIATFLDSSVDQEQCWIDNYVSTPGYGEYVYFYDSVLNVWFETATDNSIGPMARHRHAQEWYDNSLVRDNMKDFNSGVVAGAYWSVIGPGKNLQLASTPTSEIYKFQWHGWNPSGLMNFYDESMNPGRLPEPAKLVGPIDSGDPNGAVFTCKESENAVAYEFLFGKDPHRVMDYDIISDTTNPPVVKKSLLQEGWWTVRVRDQYGSTIHADARPVNPNLLLLPIENRSTGERFGYIQDAIDSAAPGDEIVIEKGIYHESINFSGKNLTIRSTNPDEGAIVEATVIEGSGKGNLVNFHGDNLYCVIAGFTIRNAGNGIYCLGSSPTITNCRISSNVANGIELHMGSNPTIYNCVIAENGDSGIAMLVFQEGRTVLDNSPNIDNCTIANNKQAGIFGGMPSIHNSIISGNATQIMQSSAIAEYSDVVGGFPGVGNIDEDPVFVDPDNGDYHLKSQAGRWDSISMNWVIDEVTSPCIDAGNPNTEIGSEKSPNGGIINMGAYGGTAEASMSP
jgi:parallel beta-helix repeat protein